MRAGFRNRALRIVAPVDRNRAATTTSHVERLIRDSRVAFDRPGHMHAVIARLSDPKELDVKRRRVAVIAQTVVVAREVIRRAI